MKTIRAARRVMRVRFLLLCVAVAAVTGMELTVGEAVAGRLGRMRETCAVNQQGWVPSADISDLMAAAR